MKLGLILIYIVCGLFFLLGYMARSTKHAYSDIKFNDRMVIIVLTTLLVAVIFIGFQCRYLFN